jgi:hypothetical protein
MIDYRGNAEEVLRLTFPGSMFEGDTPPPSFRQIDDVVKVLEGLTNRDLRYRGQLSDQFHFRLVGAKLAMGIKGTLYSFIIRYSVPRFQPCPSPCRRRRPASERTGGGAIMYSVP